MHDEIIQFVKFIGSSPSAISFKNSVPFHQKIYLKDKAVPFRCKFIGTILA